MCGTNTDLENKGSFSFFNHLFIFVTNQSEYGLDMNDSKTF